MFCSSIRIMSDSEYIKEDIDKDVMNEHGKAGVVFAKPTMPMTGKKRKRSEESGYEGDKEDDDDNFFEKKKKKLRKRSKGSKNMIKQDGSFSVNDIVTFTSHQLARLQIKSPEKEHSASK